MAAEHEKRVTFIKTAIHPVFFRSELPKEGPNGVNRLGTKGEKYY